MPKRRRRTYKVEDTVENIIEFVYYHDPQSVCQPVILPEEEEEQKSVRESVTHMF